MFIFIAGLIILLFGFVILFGAPYLPTRQAQATTALDLLDLRPGQTFCDLGCGDGRVLKLAAQRGLKAIGYELNPLLVLAAIATNWSYRKQVKVKWGDFWQADLDQVDGVFVFLLDKYMPKLDTKLKSLHKPIKLASYTFKIKNKTPTHKAGAVYLYTYNG